MEAFERSARESRHDTVLDRFGVRSSAAVGIHFVFATVTTTLRSIDAISLLADRWWRVSLERTTLAVDVRPNSVPTEWHASDDELVSVGSLDAGVDACETRCAPFTGVGHQSLVDRPRPAVRRDRVTFVESASNGWEYHHTDESEGDTESERDQRPGSTHDQRETDREQ